MQNCLRRAFARFYMGKDKFVVLLGKLFGNGVPNPANLLNLADWGVLGKIVGIVPQNFILNFLHDRDLQFSWTFIVRRCCYAAFASGSSAPGSSVFQTPSP